MAKIVIMDHPLIRHKIGLIRRKEIRNQRVPRDDRRDRDA